VPEILKIDQYLAKIWTEVFYAPRCILLLKQTGWLNGPMCLYIYYEIVLEVVNSQ